MPLFRWGSPNKINYKARLEHKMCVAKETPESSFDLSDCNLSEVPPGVYSMCRVFRKEVLLLQENHITSLKGGGSLQDLSLLKVLDLHSNKISSLPEDIGYLTHLQILHVHDNKLKKLPTSFCKLVKLRTLSLQGNAFKEFPSVLCLLPLLQKLNITRNEKLAKLPNTLCNVTSLHSLLIDPEKFIYPTSDICSEGTESIMKFLCSQEGKEYVPASEIEDDLSESKDDSAGTTSPENHSWADTDLPGTYHLYEKMKEKRRHELIQMEEALRNNQESHAQVAAESLLRRQRLLVDVAQEQERLQDEILYIQNKKDRERRHMLTAMNSLEDHSSQLIDQLINLNEKFKNTEAILEGMEKDRQETEELFNLKQEELEQLRKKDVLAAMKEMLQAEEKQRIYENCRMENMKRLQENSEDSSQRLLDFMFGRDQDQQQLINKLQEEEEYQREAFEFLQLQRDQRHREIIYQIKLIEEELSKLTMAELKKKDLKVDIEVSVLAERRGTLAMLLTQLLEEKEKREDELKKRVYQMERLRENEMKDYWLIQYQKLMDRKPQELIDMENAMDPMVRTILLEAGAEDYVPLFAAKMVTWPQLLSMTIKDLKKLGIIHDSVCYAIIKKASDYYVPEGKPLKMDLEVKVVPSEEISEEIPSPSAPPEEIEEPVEATPSAPELSPQTEMKLWCQLECVVCLDKQSTAVFLPCGHVCCCWACSEPLDTCPMCRTDITNKFALTLS